MKPNEVADEIPQCLTHPENVNIIVSLCAVEAREKSLARYVVGLQVALVLIATSIAYNWSCSLQYALAVLGGGLVSIINGAMLAWRMSRVASHSAHEAPANGGAHQQLRLLYFYAAERFLVVFVLLGLCLAVLKLTPLAVMGGFVTGQAALIVARLILIRTNKF